MLAEQPENQASDLLGHFDLAVVEARMEPVEDIRMVVVVEVDSNPVVVVVVLVDHHTVDSDNLAGEPDCKAGLDTEQEAAHHTEDTEAHSLAEGQEDDTAAVVAVVHKHGVTVDHCKDIQAVEDPEDLVAVQLASLVVYRVPVDWQVAAHHTKILVDPVARLVEDWVELVMQNPDCLDQMVEVDCQGHSACLEVEEEVSECSELDRPQTPSTPSFDEGFAQPAGTHVSFL